VGQVRGNRLCRAKGRPEYRIQETESRMWYSPSAQPENIKYIGAKRHHSILTPDFCVSTPAVVKSPFQGQTKGWSSGPGFFTLRPFMRLSNIILGHCCLMKRSTALNAAGFLFRANAFDFDTPLRSVLPVLGFKCVGPGLLSGLT
jgi:hypothetical protein